jgi:hypothetical protein
MSECHFTVPLNIAVLRGQNVLWHAAEETETFLVCLSSCMCVCVCVCVRLHTCVCQRYLKCAQNNTILTS